MSKIICFGLSIIASTVWLSACSIKADKGDTKDAEDIVRKMEDDNKRNQDDVDKILNNPALVAGGQPGKISISGIIVKEQDGKTLLDERISISQLPGKSSSDVVNTQISPESKAVLVSKAEGKDLEKLSIDETFANLNCKQLDPALVEGLTEIPSKPLSEGVLAVSANTVVMCKEVQYQLLVNSVSADHLILIDVDSTLVGAIGGSISMSANKLTLIGKNNIGTKGSDSSGIIMSAPSIDLKVIKEIDGEGSLQLISVGGNNVKSESKK